jgi:hypothetical protein
MGALLPLIFVFYDILQKKVSKRIIWFVIPPFAYMMIRITNWFGFGWVYMNFNYNYISKNFVVYLMNNIAHDIITSIGVTVINPVYAIIGLMKLTVIALCLLIILDLIISWIICQYIIIILKADPVRIPDYSEKIIQFIIFCLIGIFFSYLTISANGYIESRYLLIIDFFLVMVLTFLIIPMINKRKCLFIMIFALCLLLNQGLYINWIISGDIQDSVNHGIISHSGEIIQKSYFFINVSDFYKAQPNFIFTIGPKYSLHLNQYSNQIYDPYLNSQGLSQTSFESMVIHGAHINPSTTRLIYGTNGNVFVSAENGTITYVNSNTGNYYKINQSDYYEGNSSNLLAGYNTQIMSVWFLNK